MAQTKTTTVAAAARRVHRHPKTVRRWCTEKNFGVLVGGRWEIPEDNLDRIERALKLANGGGLLRSHIPSTQRRN